MERDIIIETKLIKLIHSFTKKELEEIVWSYALLRCDENMEESIKFLKKEISGLRMSKK